MKVAAGAIIMACCLYAQSGERSGPEEIRIQRYLAATMRDGVKLYGDLYRPAREGKFPTLIVRTPYGVQRDGVHQALIKFAQHGYARLRTGCPRPIRIGGQVGPVSKRSQ